MFAEVCDATTGAYFRSSGKPIRGAMESDRAPQNLRSDKAISIYCLEGLSIRPSFSFSFCVCSLLHIPIGGGHVLFLTWRLMFFLSFFLSF